jgi:hypothetical protein
MVLLSRRTSMKALAWFARVGVMGLAACTPVPSPLSLLPHAEDVNVLHSTTDLSRQCASLGRLSESDGQADGRGRYNGAEDRALLRLRNDAGRIGANALVVLDKQDVKNREVPLDEIAVDCPHCKRVVWMTVDAYRCPGKTP